MPVAVVDKKDFQDPGSAIPYDLLIASDHAGFSLKEELKVFLHESYLRLRCGDVGTYCDEAVDYPDFANFVSQAVSTGRVPRGILICGSGIGMSIAANRHANVRAALCFDEEGAVLSRRHNDANILVLAGRRTSATKAKAILRAWLETGFDGGRHQARILKIDNR